MHHKNETLKLILGIGDLMVNRFLLFDALTFEFNELKSLSLDFYFVPNDYTYLKEEKFA